MPERKVADCLRKFADMLEQGDCAEEVGPWLVLLGRSLTKPRRGSPK